MTNWNWLFSHDTWTRTRGIRMLWMWIAFWSKNNMITDRRDCVSNVDDMDTLCKTALTERTETIHEDKKHRNRPLPWGSGLSWMKQIWRKMVKRSWRRLKRRVFSEGPQIDVETTPDFHFQSCISHCWSEFNACAYPNQERKQNHRNQSPYRLWSWRNLYQPRSDPSILNPHHETSNSLTSL